MLAVVVSRADEVSERIGDHLLSLADWQSRHDDDRPDGAGGGEYHVLPAGEDGVEGGDANTSGDGSESGDGGEVEPGRERGAERVELRTFEQLHLYLDGVAAAFGGDGREDDADREPDLLAFPSRHSGETGPLLTAHFTGNVGPAEYGGEAGELATAAPNALSRVVAALDRHAPEGYEVGIESTHHGPSRVGCPSLFVEVGSDEPQWRDLDATVAAARAVLALRDVDPYRERTVVGLGGGHYAPRFERVLRQTPWAVGHVAADWGLEQLDPASASGRATLRAAFERSDATRALVDGDRPDLRVAVEELGYETVSESWLRAVGERPLPVVAAVEERLGPVADGVALGDRTTTRFAVVELPAELLAEAQGVDPERTRRAVERETVALETTEGGSRVGGRAALPVDAEDARGDAAATAEAGSADRRTDVAGADEAYDAVVDGLAAVVGEKYGTVERRDGAVVATRTAFDPALAREAGVPEGPAFGRLAGGEPVEVDGRTVTPEAVHREERRRFEV